MTTFSAPWSSALQSQTREAVAEMMVAPDGRLHLKHKVNGYAYMTAEDILSGRLRINSKTSQFEMQFPSIQLLLEAGWVVD